MSKSLEDEIAYAIKHGLLHLSLNKCWSGPDWEAVYRNTDNVLVSSVKHPDPVEALRKAARLGSKQEEPPARTRQRRRSAFDDTPTQEASRRPRERRDLI